MTWTFHKFAISPIVEVLFRDILQLKKSSNIGEARTLLERTSVSDIESQKDLVLQKKENL